jgi:ABC-type molybdenum transport system ATPase subunit/photorepair protein PhrA
MRITHLLDLPSVSFSSGQTRRGRIASALLTRPVLLLLEDPMAGLDIKSRAEVSKVLGELDSEGDIRVVLVLRGKGEGLPDWVENVVDIRSGNVWIGDRSEWERLSASTASIEEVTVNDKSAEKPEKREGKPVVELNGVTVSYGEGTREVLKGIDWTIRDGEKWHLQGSNGMSLFIHN